MKFVFAASIIAFCTLHTMEASAGSIIGKPYAKPPSKCMRMFVYFKNFRGPAAFATPNGMPVKDTKSCGQSEKPYADEEKDAVSWCNNSSHSYSCKVIAKHN